MTTSIHIVLNSCRQKVVLLQDTNNYEMLEKHLEIQLNMHQKFFCIYTSHPKLTFQLFFTCTHRVHIIVHPIHNNALAQDISMHNKLCKKNHLVFDWSYRTITSPVNSVREIALCRWHVYFPLTLSLVVPVATVHLVILSITLQHNKLMYK